MVEMQGNAVRDVIGVVLDRSRRILDVYRADPGHVQEHANGERRITQGGYGDRQIYELVQNGADEIPPGGSGRIHVVLTDRTLYCANTGNPISPEGADTILRMSVSRKRGGQIGRFGVGVKSVLSITDTPKFFSTSGSFGFDRRWSAEEIRKVLPDLPDDVETPVLRMAVPLDPDRACAQDPMLAELMSWASTVVVLPLKNVAVAKRLGEDLASFPKHFLLFSENVGEVVLQDGRSTAPRRQIRVLTQGRRGDVAEIRESVDGKVLPTEDWWVFHREHEPSLTAQEQAGELHGRPTIRISWAVPATGNRHRSELGRFWAYFPTNYSTTLRGALNAAWKTNEDRQNLLVSTFNQELIKVAAELVVDSLPKVRDPGDPAVHLQLITARGREAAQWADEELSKLVLDVAASRPSLPDQNGTLRRPQDIHLHPDHLHKDWLTIWADCSARPANWCHRAVEESHRRGRARDIMERAGRRESTVTEWLEALVRDRDPAGSVAALRIAAEMVHSGSAYAGEALQARILLTEQGGLVAPRGRVQVYRRSVTAETLDDDLAYVHPRVLTDPDGMRAVVALGIPEADALGRFESVLRRGFEQYGPEDWDAFWRLLRAAGPAPAVGALQRVVPGARKDVHVRNAEGAFVPMTRCLLAGRVIPADSTEDRAYLIDPHYHRGDDYVLRALEATDGFSAGVDPRGADWFEDYQEAVREQYYRTLAAGARRPTPKSLVVDGALPPGPLDLLCRLSEPARARLVRTIPDGSLIHHWRVTRSGTKQPPEVVRSPLVWMLRRYGRFETSRGVRGAGDCVGPQLARFDALLPVAEVDQDTALAVGLPASLDRVAPKHWQAVFDLIATAGEDDDKLVGGAYALLALATEEGAPIPWAQAGPTRCRLGADWGEADDKTIAVTDDRETYAALRAERIPALLAPTAEDAERMRTQWEMLAPGEVLTTEVEFEPAGEAVPLLDLYPRLRGPLKGLKADLQHCTSLAEVVRTPHGRREEPLKEVRHGTTVLLCGPEGELEVLEAVDRVLGLRLGPVNCRALLKQQEKDRSGRRMLEVRRTKDVPTKLLLAVGEEALRTCLPDGLLALHHELTERPATGRDLATLAMDAHREDVLRKLASAFVAAGFDAPSQWAGSQSARRFVKEYGFPDSWAGDPMAKAPEATTVVSGPRDFPALHEYQENLVSNMFRLLMHPTPQRAMLELPTGAGKTRVAVEATVRAMARWERRGPVLWIAQSAELCEQAVETWTRVWSQVGPKQDLRISRFWGGSYRPENTSGHHVVVAVDDSLRNHLPTEEFAWLREAAAVIVDEAHFAVPTTYTKIFAELGLTHQRTTRPLVGLTATAFRGTNEEETKRLVDRFHGRRLDDGVFGEDTADAAYAYLQAKGVLSQVEQHLLEGASVPLTEDQIADVRRNNSMDLPDAIVKAIAADTERNRRIIEEIEQLDGDWPVLVFAASVEHAKVLAALLNSRGTTATSIDGNTQAGLRRRRIEDFRSGRVQVLTNYNVLTQGFDAPAVRAVVVARPTYSPNTYIQMIGRGLRGPANGGKPECLILNVRDNVENFGRELAYTQFEHLWNRGRR